MRLLDIAAGTGALATQAAAAGAKVTAIDSSEGMLDVLRAKIVDDFELEALIMDGQDLQLRDETFDRAVPTWDRSVLRPGEGTREMHRVVRGGGRGRRDDGSQAQ